LPGSPAEDRVEDDKRATLASRIFERIEDLLLLSVHVRRLGKGDALKESYYREKYAKDWVRGGYEIGMQNESGKTWACSGIRKPPPCHARRVRRRS